MFHTNIENVSYKTQVNTEAPRIFLKLHRIFSVLITHIENLVLLCQGILTWTSEWRKKKNKID